jgi:hypothetical protein
MWGSAEAAGAALGRIQRVLWGLLIIGIGWGLWSFLIEPQVADAWENVWYDHVKGTNQIVKPDTPVPRGTEVTHGLGFYVNSGINWLAGLVGLSMVAVLIISGFQYGKSPWICHLLLVLPLSSLPVLLPSGTALLLLALPAWLLALWLDLQATLRAGDWEHEASPLLPALVGRLGARAGTAAQVCVESASLLALSLYLSFFFPLPSALSAVLAAGALAHLLGYRSWRR